MRLEPDGPRPWRRLTRRLRSLALPVALAAITVAVFQGGLSAPFIFDDAESITDNPAIRGLWPPTRFYPTPPTANAVAGRPLVSVSLALSYAVGGLDVRAYHAFSLALHVVNGLLLLGILRLTLARRAPELWRSGAAAAVALLWLVHPLQTESVTYAIQRTELMMGGFYLGTLYAAIRAWDSPHPRRWHVLAVALCGLGMASKEVMVSAPLMVLLYDRAFVTGSFREAFRRRRALYAGLAGTWLILLALVLDGEQARMARPSGQAAVAFQYLLVQGQVVLHYLRLSFWPDVLSVVYDWPARGSLSQHGPYAAGMGAIALLTLVALWRNSWLGFLGAWFFLILAPTSSIVPLATEVVAERRMYLPLAAFLTLALVGAYAGLLRLRPRATPWLAGGLVLVVAGALAVRSVARVGDYATTVSIWSAAVRDAPASAIGRTNLGKALIDSGRLPEAEAELRLAITLAPHRPAAYQYLGLLLSRQGALDEAESLLRESVRLAPNDMRLAFTLAGFLGRRGAVSEAERLYRTVVAHQEQDWEAHAELGRLLLRAGRREEALAPLRRAVSHAPSEPAARHPLAMTLADAGMLGEAERELSALAARRPADPVLRNHLGTVLVRSGRSREAIDQFEQAVRLRPSYAVARYNLAASLAAADRPGEALRHFRAVVAASDAPESLRNRAAERALALEGAGGGNARP